MLTKCDKIACALNLISKLRTGLLKVKNIRTTIVPSLIRKVQLRSEVTGNESVELMIRHD